MEEPQRRRKPKRPVKNIILGLLLLLIPAALFAWVVWYWVMAWIEAS